MAILSASFRLSTVLFAGMLAAQQNSQPAQSPDSSAPKQAGTEFTLRQDVNRVVLDIVVTDPNGKPVRGLTQNDFSVYEDGQPQDVLSFDAYSLDAKPGYFAKLPSLPKNTFVNIATEPERGPLYVLLLDLINTEQDNQPYARQQLLKFIANKPQGTRFAAFVLSDSLHLVQGFTANREQFYAVLDPVHPKAHVPRIFLLGANYGRSDSGMTLEAFRQIALYLEGLPGRKNIIWFSGKFPLDLFPHNDDRPDTRDEVAETLDALTRSQTAIYSIDVTGVDPYPPGRLTGGAGMAAMRVAGTGDSVYDNNIVQDTIADMTGGRALHGTNDLKDALEEATEAGANYYTLTYSPTNQNFNGKLRKIKVQLDSGDKGYKLEYRRGYLGSGPESQFLPEKYSIRKGEDTSNLRQIGDSLSAYMEHGAPIARDVYFRAHVKPLGAAQLATPVQMASLVDQPTYFQARKKKHPNKELAPIKLQTYLVEYQVIARLPHLEVAAGIYDDDGVLLNGDVEETSSANSNPDDPKAKFTYFRVQQKIDAPLNAASLRLAVRDASTNRMGTMEIPLPVAPE